MRCMCLLWWHSIQFMTCYDNTGRYDWSNLRNPSDFETYIFLRILSCWKDEPLSCILQLETSCSIPTLCINRVEVLLSMLNFIYLCLDTVFMRGLHQRMSVNMFLGGLQCYSLKILIECCRLKYAINLDILYQKGNSHTLKQTKKSTPVFKFILLSGSMP